MNVRHEVSKELPPKKKGWNHSDRVLVYYEAVPDFSTERWGIAYYHYDPPFETKGKWVDWGNSGTPKYWWELPSV
jgi:hypothetical protein